MYDTVIWPTGWPPAAARSPGLTSRFEAERTVIRAGRARPLSYVKRLFGYPELRDWLLAAGFTTVSGYGEDGHPLTPEHQRMVMAASR
jgi:hypothetical protein